MDHGPLTDDRLRLVFTCAHPALSMEARVALTLKVVAGLTTADVARMFLVTEATMGQRLLRAKKRIAHAGIPYRVPGAADLPDRLDGVLAVVYLVFTQGYAGAAADELAEEAIRLGRLLVDLMPDEDEARGLLALMLAQHARRAARLVDGELVTLEHQDRSRWDQRRGRRGDGARHARGRHAGKLPAPGRARPHAPARRGRGRHRLAPDRRPLRAAARPAPLAGGRAQPRCRGRPVPRARPRDCCCSTTSPSEPALQDLHLFPAARADLLARAGRTDEAVAALDRALVLAPTDQERRQLAAARAELEQ